MVSNLVENLTRDVMLELAGESYFERGEDYHRGRHVHDLVEHAGVVVARVAGTEDYRVRLWAEDDLVFSCDCPLGLDGEFCTLRGGRAGLVRRQLSGKGAGRF